jgi:predicted negative regulator of RcsB-dependent stress response
MGHHPTILDSSFLTHMATPLDSADQEQLDQLKYFWSSYGTLITWAVLLVAGAFVAWNGWQYMERSKTAQASALYDEIERSAQAGDMARIEKSFGLMKDKFSGTPYAQQAGLAVAKVLHEKGNDETSRAALLWVGEHAIDSGYQAIAKLRLAGELLDTKSYDDALKQLSGSFPKEFEPLVADRKGDIYQVQGKRDEAQAEYKKAWMLLDPENAYRRLVEVKLNAVGIDPKTLVANAATESPVKATP